jgi:hypothetical protein
MARPMFSSLGSVSEEVNPEHLITEKSHKNARSADIAF